jgi:hypothetical protein
MTRPLLVIAPSFFPPLFLLSLYGEGDEIDDRVLARWPVG